MVKEVASSQGFFVTPHVVFFVGVFGSVSCSPPSLLLYPFGGLVFFLILFFSKL